MKNRNYLIQVWLLAIFTMILHSCAPVFSEMQSARLVGENQVEITPSGSLVSFTNEGDSEAVQNHFGLMGAYGINSWLDLRMRYEYIWLREAEMGYHVLGLGPKFSLVENKMAFALPIGRAFGDDTSDTWQMHPTLILTLPAMEDRMDINLSTKYLIPFCQDCEGLIAINLGLALSTDVKRWAIRPEYGHLYNPGEKGHFRHFSLGFSWVLGK